MSGAVKGALALWGDLPRRLDDSALLQEGARLALRAGQGALGHLPATRRAELAVHALALVAWLRSADAPPRLVGLHGGQGSGKSTLAMLAAQGAREVFGLRAAVLGLDDLYLPQSERAELAARVHPFLATRGVPGTHDVGLGHAVLDALLGVPGAAAVTMPRFDKRRDDRAPEAADADSLEAVDLVFFEGWCVGVGPEPSTSLVQPCNALEAEGDNDGRWRRWVDGRLATDYAALFARLDALVMLQVPDFGAVRRWREAQEAELRRAGAGAMTPEAVQRFVAFYERLTRHALASLPARADLRFVLDGDHGIAAVAAHGADAGH